MKKYFYLLIIIIWCAPLASQQLAFPGAEGFGKYTSGGRGGAVIEVTNLNDNGAGSLREALLQNGTRTIVFRVSGTIYLNSPLDVSKGNVTIAGQTAPGDGITLANYNFEVKADNVIVRYIRSRMGDNVNQEDDAFTCRNRQNVIIDHCSFSWGIDEVASCYENKNFTMQWCIISESLYNSVHEKGLHGYGGIWGGSRVSFIYNLLAHHSSRNPRFNGARGKAYPWEEIVDFRNNVIYNWGFNSSYAGEPSDIDTIRAYINMVGNYYKSGPGTNTGAKRYRILEPYAQGTKGYSRWYIDSNFVYNYPDATADNWLYGVQNVTAEEKITMKSSTPFDFDISTNYSAEEIFPLVLENAGVTLPYRDTVDKRIAWETETGTAIFGGPTWGANKGILDTQNDAGGFPEIFSAPPLPDRDHDGMPDLWEETNNLNPDNPDDRNGDSLGFGYTNLEYYLNSISKFREYIRPPSNLSAIAGYDSIQLIWKNNSTLSEKIVIERKEDGDFYILDTLTSDTESFIDTSVNSAQEYSYRLIAFNSADISVYSEIITTSTLSGLINLFTGQKIKFFPNPASDHITLQLPGQINDNISIFIYDITGELHLQRIIEKNDPNNSELFLDISSIKQGTYFLRVNTTDITHVSRLTIIK